MSAPSPRHQGVRRAGRVVAATALAAWAVLCLLITQGAASFVVDCDVPLYRCGQLVQAVTAGIATLALGVAAASVLDGRRAALLVLLGTAPLLAAHYWLWVTIPNESAFFPLMAVPPPLAAVLVLLARLVRRGLRGLRAPDDASASGWLAPAR